MSKYFYVLMMLLGLSVSAQAEARGKLLFGDEDHLRFVADIKMPGPQGQHMELSRRVTYKSFLLPYRVVDNGFVITEKGKHDKYYPMPAEILVAAAQSQGLMPKPLPEWHFSLLDYVIGYILWIMILGIVLGGIVQRAWHKKKVARIVNKHTQNKSK